MDPELEYIRQQYYLAQSILKEWANKQGQELCWWHPDILGRLCEVMDVPRPQVELPDRRAFKNGCKDYQDKLYGSEPEDEPDPGPTDFLLIGRPKVDL